MYRRTWKNVSNFLWEVFVVRSFSKISLLQKEHRSFGLVFLSILSKKESKISISCLKSVKVYTELKTENESKG